MRFFLVQDGLKSSGDDHDWREWVRWHLRPPTNVAEPAKIPWQRPVIAFGGHHLDEQIAALGMDRRQSLHFADQPERVRRCLRIDIWVAPICRERHAGLPGLE